MLKQHHQLGFEHRNCFRPNAPCSIPEILTESLAEVFGVGAIWLQYDYPYPKFTSSEEGHIRLFMPNDKGYLKKYDETGTIAFRMDSVLYHLNVMRGAFHGSSYGLKPGQLLPSQYIDERVKAWWDANSDPGDEINTPFIEFWLR